MTLIVSEVSDLGIIMASDSAVTVGDKSGEESISQKEAKKVHYSIQANIGVALWGNATVDGLPMDFWVEDFLKSECYSGITVDELCTLILQEMNPLIKAEKKPWNKQIRGLHVAGFIDGRPVLYHLHTGHIGEPPHELRLHRDFPDDCITLMRDRYENDITRNTYPIPDKLPIEVCTTGTALLQPTHRRELPIGVRRIDPELVRTHNFTMDLAYASIEGDGFFHLRNGMHEAYAVFFEMILEYAICIKHDYRIGLNYPMRNLKCRLSFYESHIRFMTSILTTSGELPCIGGRTSGIAFQPNGLVIDTRPKGLHSLPKDLNAKYLCF